jgi:hypothetical protein
MIVLACKPPARKRLVEYGTKELVGGPLADLLAAYPDETVVPETDSAIS